jgi:hypothetical protein
VGGLTACPGPLPKANGTATGDKIASTTAVCLLRENMLTRPASFDVNGLSFHLRVSTIQRTGSAIG